MLSAIVIAMAISALAAAGLAISRNRDPGGWFLIGVLLPTYSIVLICLMPPLKGSHCGCRCHQAP